MITLFQIRVEKMESGPMKEWWRVEVSNGQANYAPGSVPEHMVPSYIEKVMEVLMEDFRSQMYTEMRMRTERRREEIRETR